MISIGLLLKTIFPCLADKKEDYQRTYHYLRALELLKEDKNEEAIASLKKEIADHKDNGYAYVWLASVLNQEERIGEALINVNKAMKYLGKKDDMYEFCYYLRSKIYGRLGETQKALDDLNTSVSLFPQSASAYENRADYYLDQDNFDLANRDFLKMIELDPGNIYGYMGCGICLRCMERYKEAVEKFDYVLKLSSSHSRAYAQRAYCYYLLQKYTEAAADNVKALDIDGDDMAFDNLKQLADSAFDVIDFKLKVQQMLQPNNYYWPYCRGMIYEYTEKYKEAIPLYAECKNIKFNPMVMRRISACHYQLGHFAEALEANREGLDADSTIYNLIMDKALYLDELGRSKEAIAEYTHAIELAPDNAHGYQMRGWVKEHTGDTIGAIEDYSMAIMTDPDLIYVRYSRGKLYQKSGHQELAKKDFEFVVSTDVDSTDYQAAFYAWFYLGDTEKAKTAMDCYLKDDSKETYYEAACLYALMDEKNTALKYLQISLEKGFSRFFHIGRDADLDNLRSMPEFQELMDRFNPIRANPTAIVNYETVPDSLVEKVVEIGFSHEGGVTKVKCTINDLPLHFIFDTGASDVSISTVEATFMLKNGYLSEKDIAGTQNYITADGSISEGTVINLRKVNLGSLELDNVKASVIKNQKAPLLLGQSVLQRLGKIEIDNSRKTLKVTHKVKRAMN